ncbi:peptidylprolyl isomerase [bacterium]|nr:peptidylprolyl isomerase [bacterium]
MKKLVGFCVSIMLSLLLLNGCSGEKENTDSVDAKEGKTVDSTKIVAVVNGIDVTEGDLLKKIDEMNKAGGKTGRIQMGGGLRKEALANLINYKLLGMAVVKERISVSEEALNDRIAEIKKGYSSTEQFLDRLKEMGFDESTFRSRLVEQLKIQNLIDKQTETLEAPSQKEIREYYDSHPEAFMKPEQVNASHILITVNKDDDEKTKKEKREKLEKILKDIRNGASFSENASLYSDCPSKSKGGNLGFFKKGDMVKPFSDMAFSIGKGKVSDIVETRFGYHIIKVLDKKEAETISLEEAQKNIVSYLEGMEKNKIVNEYLTNLRMEANIEYADSSLIQP